MSYLTAPTCLALGETLIELARVEQQIEVIRKLLCEQPRFHPYKGFKAIVSHKGAILPTDLKSFLDANGFVADVQQCKIFISNYDQDGDGTMQYSEFLRAVLPLTDPDLRQTMTLQAPSQDLDQRSEYTLAKLIDREIKLTLELDYIKEQLLQCYDFTPALCFQQIDAKGQGKIYMDDLEYFFYVNAIIGIIHPKSLVYDDEIVAMFKRIDLLNDGLIDTDEFTRAITQHSVITDSKYQSPIKSSQYLQRYLYTPPLNSRGPQKTATFQRSSTQASEVIKANSVIYDTPPKQRSQVSSLERSKRQSRGKQYEFDETMSNVITQSIPNKTTKIVKNYESPLRNSQIQQNSYSILRHKTPQKYIDQKADLRAQLQLSKLSANTYAFTHIRVSSSTAKVLKQNSSKPKQATAVKPVQKTPTKSAASTKANTTAKRQTSDRKPVTQRKASEQISKPEPSKPVEALKPIQTKPVDTQMSEPQASEVKKLDTTPKKLDTKKLDTKKSQSMGTIGRRNDADPRVFYSQILIDILEIEKSLETMKRELALRNDFNLYDAFRAIDTRTQGHTTGHELDDFVNLRQGTMNLLVLKYGVHGSLRFSDFIYMILPRSRDHADMMQSRQPVAVSAIVNAQLFSQATLTLYKDVLYRCLEREISLEKVREQLRGYKYSNLQEAFQLMDIKTRDGWLSLEDLDEFLIDQNVKYSIQDLSLLIRTLDYNQDGYVTVDDFINLLS